MDFQGFQNNLPVIITVIVVALLLLLSWLSYRGYDTISGLSKFFLSSLRASALLILYFLFLNPFFKTEKTIEKPSKIAFFLDDSESTSITKGEYAGSESYLKLLNNIERRKPSSVSLNYFGFSSNIEPIKRDSLALNKPATNLSEVVSYINSLEAYNSAVIISDGIITYGKNPVIEARNSLIPIYTIGIGDTTKVRDLALLNITTNSTGFSNTKHVATIDLSQYGFEGKTISISLFKDDIELQTRELVLSSKKEIESVTFELSLNEPGLNQYIVVIEPIEGEWITSNNKTSFSIDVLDSKTRILHIANSVHPDIKTIRSILAADENFELTSYDFLGKSTSSITDATNFDLVIIHGFPSQTIFTNLGLDIDTLPTLFINLPHTSKIDYNTSFVLVEDLSQQLIKANLYFIGENRNHPILDNIEEVDFTRLAPVYTRTRTKLSKPDATTLISAQLQGVNLSSPLLSLIERGNIRRSELHAFGWYKMFLSNNSNEREFVTVLINNIVSWTATDPDNRLLKIGTSNNTYTVVENPIINASLINENGSIESNATINLTLDSEEATTKTYTLSNIGNGLYKLNLPALPSGKYNYEATAIKEGRSIESQQGAFLVIESSSELANTTRNDEILRGISERSNGLFHPFDDDFSIWDDLKNQNLLGTTTSVEESYLFPVKYVFWFILVLILLASEWMFRKRFSLP